MPSAYSPTTFTGVVELVVVPSPSCPDALRPVHLTVPSARSTHVTVPLSAVTATAPATPVTVTGLSEPVVVPSPRWPLPFAPQQLTVPSLRSAQVWVPAAVTLVAVEMPLTATGRLELTMVPSPS